MKKTASSTSITSNVSSRGSSRVSTATSNRSKTPNNRTVTAKTTVTNRSKTPNARVVDNTSHVKKEDAAKKSMISSRLNPHKVSNPFTTKNKHRTYVCLEN
jgi:hypothetical protein